MTPISANWTNLTTTPALTAVWVPPGGGTPWGITNEPDDNAYYYAGATEGWQLAPGAHLTDMALAENGDNGMIWGIDGDNTATNNIYTYLDGSWQQPVAGILTSIAVSLGGEVWGVNKTVAYHDGAVNVYRYLGGANAWMYIPGYLTDIALGTDGTVWGLNEGTIYKYDGELGQPWQTYTTGSPPSLTQIAVGGDNSVWGIDAGYNIWVLVEETGFEQVVGSAISISAGNVNNVWVVTPEGGVDMTSFPDVSLAVEIDDRPVYHARYTAPGAARAAIPGVRVPLQLAAEEWLDERFRSSQECARQRAGKRSPITSLGGVETAVEIAKLAWEIFKEGKPTWGGAHRTQSSMLNPSDSDWTHYVHAVRGRSETVTAKWKSFFGFTTATVKMQLAGTYHAAPQASGIMPGYYIPDIHFEFKETEVMWSYDLEGDAQISNVSNEGGTTIDDPVNPSATVAATLQLSGWLSSASKTFYFTATGESGFAVASSDVAASSNEDMHGDHISLSFVGATKTPGCP
jgi:hypothetical protein